MKLSFRGKLLLLVSFAISLAAFPIIFFSQDYLTQNTLARERESFANTVSLVEDSIALRYLNMLSTEVEGVLAAKEDLCWTASMLRDACRMKTGHQAHALLQQWQKPLLDKGFHLALFDLSGIARVHEPLVDAATGVSVTDFKGQSIRSLLVENGEGKDCTFAVTHVAYGHSREIPVLLCFMPVPEEGMIVIAVQISDMQQNRLRTEKDMIQSLQERLDELELRKGASISIIARNGEIIASKGLTITLADIPDEGREKVHDGDTLNGETVGPKGKDLLFHLAYFKAMDWYIVAVITKDAINEPAEKLSKHLLAVAAILIILSLLVMLALAMRIIQPLQQLTEKARELSEEGLSVDSDTHIEAKIREGMLTTRTDEVGQLASSFAALGKALDENIRRLKETVAVRQRIEGELSAARDIQMGILPPPDSAPRTDRFSAGAFLLPAKEVGGDLYDFFTAPDGRQVFVIGDVSDKGVSAALFMSMTVTLVRYAMAEGLSCAEAMRRINDRLAENNPSCMFVTLFIGLFDPETGDFDYASGAHCAPFVVNPDAAVPVRALSDTSGPLVGAMEGMEFTPCHAVIGPGEYCFIYTDGVSEAMNERYELFTEQRIAEELESLRDAGPDEVLVHIMDAVMRHRGEAAQSDDITMLCFKRN